MYVHIYLYLWWMKYITNTTGQYVYACTWWHGRCFKFCFLLSFISTLSTWYSWGAMIWWVELLLFVTSIFVAYVASLPLRTLLALWSFWSFDAEGAHATHAVSQSGQLDLAHCAFSHFFTLFAIHSHIVKFTHNNHATLILTIMAHLHDAWVDLLPAGHSYHVIHTYVALLMENDSLLCLPSMLQMFFLQLWLYVY